jgi:hypothetical protein
MHNSANHDIKALLTLLLLKQGTSSRDIQTAVHLTAGARLMVAQEYADQTQQSDVGEASNVARIRSARQPEAGASLPFEPHADAINSEIKALLMLLLLQNGASSHEIQTSLRLAAKSRDAAAAESEAPQDGAPAAPVTKASEHRSTPRQVRPEYLAPIGMKEYAA